jgi:hypothetical protein
MTPSQLKTKHLEKGGHSMTENLLPGQRFFLSQLRVKLANSRTRKALEVSDD